MTRSQSNVSTTEQSIFQFQEIENIDPRTQRRKEWLLSSRLNGDTQILRQLGIVDFTQEAYEGRFPRLIGLSREIKEVLIVLSKRFANTPLIYGVPGVGKSTLPRNLAQRIVNGRVPEPFRQHRILGLNLALLTAGANLRGEVGQRLKHYSAFLDQNTHVKTVIDECQLLVAKDFMESEIIHFLKMNLSMGKYQFILITDASGVRLLTEDSAIMGRIVPIEIRAASEAQVMRMFQGGIQQELSAHYRGMQLPLTLVRDAFHLSEETMPYDRAQPAKTIKLVDTAMAHEYYRRLLQGLPFTDAYLLQRTTLEKTVRQFSRADNRNVTFRERLKQVDYLADTLKVEIKGQDDIIDAISSDLYLKYREKPARIGAYFLYGDSGTGKTTLSTQVGTLMSGRDGWIRVDCSQLIDKWAITTILGSYPGLIMSDRSSMVSRVRMNPYATFIWDEIEKAHPDVIHQFLQILQPPHVIVDNRGVKLDFSNCLFFFTSNVGHSDTDKMEFGFKNENGNVRSQKDSIRLTHYFPNEFIGRLGNQIYRFHPLTRMEDLLAIIETEISKIGKRRGVFLRATKAAKEMLVKPELCRRFGARALQSELSKEIEPKLCQFMDTLRREEQEMDESTAILITKNRDHIQLVLDK